MATDLYVYLKSGRGDVLLTAVTATPTLENITVKSSPYRDLGHRGSTSGAVASLDIVSLGTGSKFVPPAGQTGGVSVATGSSGDLMVSVPDNVSHMPPRQTDILVSFWKFTCSDGIDKKFAVADVYGWGPNKRV